MADRLDRFTKRGRRVLTLAQEEARRLNHNYIGTEHLLLGLIREEAGVAARVLLDLELDLNQIYSQIEQTVGRGQRPIFGKLNLTPRVKRVIELSVDEARRLDHHYIGTEHLLLGLIREGEGAAYNVLSAFISLDQVRVQVARVMMLEPHHSASYTWDKIETILSETFIKLLRAEQRFGWLKRWLGLATAKDITESPFVAAALDHLRRVYVTEILAEFSDQEQRALDMRFGLPDGQIRALDDVAKTCGVTADRIWQIEINILRQLRSPSWTRRIKEDLTKLQNELKVGEPSTDVHVETREQLMSEIYDIVAREERNRLARDLHDSIKQQIFSISVSAAAVEARWDHDPTGARAALADVQHSAQAAMVEMNALLQQLRPDPLENLGLLEALREQCEALDYRTGATVTTAFGPLPPKAQLPVTAQETIFRLVQEALSNVARHARATQVQVRLESDATLNVLRLTIQDDGQGFMPDRERRGMGLTNMQERVALLSGQLDIESAPNQGTTIRIVIPLLAAAA